MQANELFILFNYHIADFRPFSRQLLHIICYWTIDSELPVAIWEQTIKNHWRGILIALLHQNQQVQIQGIISQEAVILMPVVCAHIILLKENGLLDFSLELSLAR
jgi:hypothetical protein